MAYQISVENIKCGGCANTIKTKISEMEQVDGCDVDVESGTVSIEGDEQHRAAVSGRLLELGYPESGTAEGLKAAKAKAKSFVSCAVGRMNS